MTRKSSIVTLCILGAIAAAGACCCCSGAIDHEQQIEEKDDKGVVHRHHVRRRWGPWFIWGGSTYVGGPHPGTTVSHPIGGGHGTSSSPRGGFGSTAHGSGSSGGSHGSGS
ncbi:MAG TPA: hypothetical protein VFE62_26565 [Gemmataceae bacterium]|nr:hypothetical protein [Gemmataceae bacterium]